MQRIESINAIIGDTLYVPKQTETHEPSFSGDDNYFDLETQKFNSTCSIITATLKIPNVPRLNSIEFWGLYLQTKSMLEQ